MSWLFSRTLVLSWAVWLGGLVGTFIAVNTIFAALAPDRVEAGRIAAQVFGNVERLMLVTAGVAVVSALGLVVSGRTVLRVVLLTLVMVAGLIGAGAAGIVSPRLNAMRVAQETQTPAFRRMHGVSMGLYVAMTGVLAAAGAVLPGAVQRTGRKE